MQRASIAESQRPQRRHVGVANRVVDLLAQLTKLERVERIDPAAAPVGPRVHPRKLLTMTKQGLTSARNHEEPVLERLGPREVGHLADGLEHVAGVEPRVRGGGLEEPGKCLRPRQRRRAAGHDHARRIRTRAIGAGVAERAIDRDSLRAEDALLREADRQFPTGLPDEPQRRIAAGQFVGEESRQHLPDPVGSPSSGSIPTDPYLKCSDPSAG